MPTLILDTIKNKIRGAVKQFQMPPHHVDYLVKGLTEASLMGIDTHGIRLPKTYVKELSGGRSNPHPNFTVESKSPAIACLDADNALGVVAGFEAVEIAIRKAKLYGISAVSVKNSNHFDATGIYNIEAARKGLIGLCFSNSDALVSAFNGAKKVTRTNPLSIAAEGENNELFLLDMATSQVAFSKVMACLKSDIQLQAAWAVDGSGTDSCGSGKVEALQPLSGYKGQSLGMMVQIFPALLSSMPFDYQLSHLYTPLFNKARKIGHFFIYINIEAFFPRKEFQNRLSEMLQHYRNSKTSEKDSVIVPGDRARKCYQHRLHAGIPIDKETFSFLTDITIKYS